MVGKMAKRDYFHSLGKSTESPIKPDWLSNQSVLKMHATSVGVTWAIAHHFIE